LDHLPDDAGHFVAVDVDDGVFDLDLGHACGPPVTVGKGMSWRRYSEAARPRKPRRPSSPPGITQIGPEPFAAPGLLLSPATETDGRMTEEERQLVDRWIVTFCEAPPVIDAELMRRLIAEQEATQKEAQSCQKRRSRPATR
ncbi:MAG: hypothetical protein VX561_02695, partial [Pseudomonadota bacterium]|nr:hypothetical protein [Pseudomonadota bacterium]